MIRSGLIVFLFLSICLPLAGQDTSSEFFRGFNSYNSYQVDSFESVNVDNNNLTLDIPIVSYPQRGQLPDLKISVSYQSWSWYTHCIYDQFQATEICFWRPSLDLAPGPFVHSNYSYYTSSRRCSFDICGNSGVYDYYFVDPERGIHNLGWVSPTVLESLDATGFQFGPQGIVDRNGIAYESGEEPRIDTVIASGQPIA